MINKDKHIFLVIRKFLMILLSLQFIGASTIAYTHLSDSECCHTKKSEDSCCMAENMPSSHCPMQDKEMGLSDCGCQHDSEAIDQFLVVEQKYYSYFILASVPQFEVDIEEGKCQSFGYELKFLPSEIPKYISNSSFLI